MAHTEQNVDLFSSIKIGGVQVKNRIIMPALILNFPIHETKIGEEWKRFYRRRAEGGVGLIIVGACYVSPEGRQDEFQIGVDHNGWLPGLESIAQVIRNGGAVPAIQLNHAGRYAMKKITGLDPVAPSAIVSKYTKEKPRELSTLEAEAIIRSFAEAARRARQAGFEAVEFLGATGYLISQFISPITNQRNDRFGGDFDQRLTFVKELIEATKEMAGEDYPIIFRLSSKDNVPGGLDENDQRRLARKLAEWDVHLINVTAGWHDAAVPQIISSVPQGFFVPYAAKIKQQVNIPVSCAVRITRPDLARGLIAGKKLDMVTLGRALIADPDWPKKAQMGNDEGIRHCICCCHCFDRAFARTEVECSVNAALGKEDILPAKKLMRVLVIGGGPAGLEAARVLAIRGHHVVLQEKEGELGGELRIASAPPFKEELLELVKFQSHELKSLGIPVHVGDRFNGTAREFYGRFDGIIVAGGAREKTMSIEGMEHLPCYLSSEILSGKNEPQDPVIIIGAGLVGGETADFLLKKGLNVSLVEIQKEPFADMGVSVRWVLMKRLIKGGVKIYTSSEVQEIRKGEIIVQTSEEALTLPAGCLVMAIGFESRDDLIEQVSRIGVPYSVIGDNQQPGRVKDAVHSGYWAATSWVDGLD